MEVWLLFEKEVVEKQRNHHAVKFDSKTTEGRMIRGVFSVHPLRQPNL